MSVRTVPALIELFLKRYVTVQNPPPVYHLPAKPRPKWFGLIALLAASVIALALPVLLFAAWGGCDPASHLIFRNNYAVPVVMAYRNNPDRNTPDRTLDTLQPGERKELISAEPDGDIDSLEVRDTSGKVLARLNHTDRNVVCKTTLPEYRWEITLGP